MIFIYNLKVIELHRKAGALKDLPARKLAYLDAFKNKELPAVIAELKKASDMNIINDISNAHHGVSEITQLQPNGQLQTWRRNDFPGESVTPGLSNKP